MKPHLPPAEEAAKALYPLDVAEKLIDAFEPLNQAAVMLMKLLEIVPNMHPPFQRLVDPADVAVFTMYVQDIARYSEAGYGPLRQLFDLLHKHSAHIPAAAQLPVLKLNLTQNKPQIPT